MYYEDDTIQHAGVVIGFGGIAGHCFVLQPRGTTGYCHRIICAQDYSAVTAACMMVKRSAFEEVGGLTEELAVAFNDIDFCMKLQYCRISDRIQSICRTVSLRVQVQRPGRYSGKGGTI